MQRVYLVSKILLTLVLAASTGAVGWNARLTLRETKGAALEVRQTAAEARRASRALANYSELQTANLGSPQSQKMIELSLKAAAGTQATVHTLNSRTLPLINETIGSARSSFDNLAALINDTNVSVNEKLLPQITETARVLGTSIEMASHNVQKILETGLITVQEVRDLMADPNWTASLENVARGTESLAGAARNVDQITAHGEQAARELPSIARGVEKVVTARSRQTKILFLAELMVTLSRIW